MKKIILAQLFVLLAGTLFAWFNFINELISYSNKSSCAVGCAASANPFLAPCFGGAIFFTIALILHLVILKKGK